MDASKAWKLEPDGGASEMKPGNGRHFTLEELQGAVGGYIELLRLEGDRFLVLNEDGRAFGLEVNATASLLARRVGVAGPIVGTAVVCPAPMVD